jgi:hypothetical protein
MALKAKPKAWWSWTFRIFDAGREIAEISFACMREAGVLQLSDATYRLYRQGTFSGLFVLERNGDAIAQAEKPSAFVRSFNVQHGGKTYTLEAESHFRRKFVLREAGSIIGTIVPERACYRDALIDLPVALPLPVRLFMVWLTLLLWKREADSAVVVT